MNVCIDRLNEWGGAYLSFAWSMLWQSSLLMAILCALDRLLTRRIRAAVLYALWLAVPVKLLLPPALALPISAAWWLFPMKPAFEAPGLHHDRVVAPLQTATAQVRSVPQISAFPGPGESKLDAAGWAVLSSGGVSAVLLLWMIARWRQVVGVVWNSRAKREYPQRLEAAQSLVGRQCPCVKILENPISPAVCGLFRPVILIPRALVERLSVDQLQAVLLHELFHIRRKDGWVNCAQALLQMIYWWHPLLWLANTRIRRLREEAVDDAVMLALVDGASTYAATLLEVAKLAFHRPLMALGLVGIMESKSALGQRIARLVDYRAPRTAGLINIKGD